MNEIKTGLDLGRFYGEILDEAYRNTQLCPIEDRESMQRPGISFDCLELGIRRGRFFAGELFEEVLEESFMPRRLLY